MNPLSEDMKYQNELYGNVIVLNKITVTVTVTITVAVWI